MEVEFKIIFTFKESDVVLESDLPEKTELTSPLTNERDEAIFPAGQCNPICIPGLVQNELPVNMNVGFGAPNNSLITPPTIGSTIRPHLLYVEPDIVSRESYNPVDLHVKTRQYDDHENDSISLKADWKHEIPIPIVKQHSNMILEKMKERAYEVDQTQQLNGKMKEHAVCAYVDRFVKCRLTNFICCTSRHGYNIYSETCNKTQEIQI